MRSCQTIFKQFLNVRLRKFRFAHGYTQERMAELLHISTRAYSDLERGKYSASALTMLFFMSELQETETLALLNDFRKVMPFGAAFGRGVTEKRNALRSVFYLPCGVSCCFSAFLRLFSTRRDMPYITQKGGTM